MLVVDDVVLVVENVVLVVGDVVLVVVDVEVDDSGDEVLGDVGQVVIGSGVGPPVVDVSTAAVVEGSSVEETKVDAGGVARSSPGRWDATVVAHAVKIREPTKAAQADRRCIVCVELRVSSSISKPLARMSRD